MKHFVFLLWPMLAGSFALAAPLPADQHGPVDVRRTTLLVRDIDRSLPLYRDALGLTVFYDQVLGGNEAGDPPTSRLVLLRANDDFIGAIGLYQRFADPDPGPVHNRRPVAGDVIIVINARDLPDRFEAIRQTPGVSVHTEPEIRVYPSADGEGTIPVLFSAIYDPDGFFIEINSIQGQPAGTE